MARAVWASRLSVDMWASCDGLKPEEEARCFEVKVVGGHAPFGCSAG